MPPAFVVRFYPTGPWRLGPDSGERDRVESLLHSDALSSAVSWAMERLDLLGDWIEAAFPSQEQPAVRFSSCFPFQDDQLFVVPPVGLWPPAPSSRIRWKGARFVPLGVVEALLADRPLDEDAWRVDGLSECLLPSGWSRGPLRQAIRSNAAVDRQSGQVAVHRAACLEFSPGGGMWAVVAFADAQAQQRWAGRVQAALRLLADSGIGGERSRGWGRSRQPEFESGVLPDLLLRGKPAEPASPDLEAPPAPPAAYWLLSLFSPAAGDRVDWKRGDYSLLTRAGRLEGAQGLLKKHSRMVAEGSVLVSDTPPSGAAQDVAPEGAPHPSYRAGFAVALPIPYREVPR